MTSASMKKGHSPLKHHFNAKKWHFQTRITTLFHSFSTGYLSFNPAQPPKTSPNVNPFYLLEQLKVYIFGCWVIITPTFYRFMPIDSSSTVDSACRSEADLSAGNLAYLSAGIVAEIPGIGAPLNLR